MSAEYICPVLTAFNQDGSVDMEAMKTLFDHLIEGGLDGIAIATMGRGNPFGTVLAALLFGVLRNGATGMNRSTSIPGEFIQVLQALVILFVSTPGIIRVVQKSWKRKRFAQRKEEVA